MIADTGSVRGLWKSWLARLVVLFPILCAAYVGCQLLIGYLAKSSPVNLRDVLVACAAILGAAVISYLYQWLVRWTERRRADELLRSRNAVTSAAAGVLLGGALFCAVYTILWALGIVSFQGYGSAKLLAGSFAVSLIAAFAEEVIFRGVIYRLCEQGLGTTLAVIVSGVLFGLIHAGNPGATLGSTAAIALEAGVLLAAAYAMTRSLWLPIGLHFGWNFTEGGIFGAAVSGGASTGLVNAPLAGPTYLTGGAFGPEASIVAVAVTLVASFFMLILVAKRGQWRPLRFQLKSGEAST